MVLRMKLSLVAVSLLSTGACFQGEAGSGTIKTDTRPLSAFTQVEVHGALKVVLESSAKSAAQVETDDNLLKRVKTEIEGGRLKLSLEGNIRPSKMVQIRLTAAQPIEKVSVFGASQLEVALSPQKTLALDVSGAGSIQARGQVDALTVKSSGAARLFAKELRAQTVRLESSGAAKAEVFAEQRLEVKSSGASSIRYRGEPKVHKEISGAGSVKPL